MIHLPAEVSEQANRMILQLSTHYTDPIT